MSWCMKCMVQWDCDICIRVIDDIWIRCMRMWTNLLHCCWIGENKSLTAAWNVECKSSCLWSWSVDEFPLREINVVVREISCIACEIMLGNPKRFGDFYRGVITGSFVPLGIKLHTVGGFYRNILERFPYFLQPLVIIFLFCKW